MSDVTESRWFKISLFVISATTTVVSSFNLWAIYKLRSAINNGGNTGLAAAAISGVSSGEITFLLIANFTLLILSVALLIYSLWKLMASKKTRTKLGQNVYEAVTTEEGGYDIFTEEEPEETVPLVRRQVRPAPAAPAEEVIVRRTVRPAAAPAPSRTVRITSPPTGARSRVVPSSSTRRFVTLPVDD